MTKVIEKDGQYLQYTERTTHTGTHMHLTWTADLNHASTFNWITPRLRKLVTDSEANLLDVIETRTVVLK